MRRIKRTAAACAAAFVLAMSGSAFAAQGGFAANGGAPNGVASEVNTSDSGFTIERSLTNQPIQLFSPRGGELWIMEQDAAGQLVLEHGVEGRWTSTTLDAQVAPWQGYRDISGSAWNDVWVAAGNKLFHYDGHTWAPVTPPTRADGTSAGAEKLADVPGPRVYVATHQDGVFLYDGASWTPLGKPAPLNQPRFPGEKTDQFWPLAMRVVDGELFVVFEYFSGGANGYLYAHSGSQWVQLTSGLGTRSSGVSTIYNSWLVPGGDRLVALGQRSARGQVIGGACTMWPDGSAPWVCPHPSAVGGADILPDGSVVLGGSDYVDTSMGPPRIVQGAFRLRSPDGTEMTLSGDPGDETLGVVAEPGMYSGWAITRTGSTWYLQRGR